MILSLQCSIIHLSCADMSMLRFLCAHLNWINRSRSTEVVEKIQRIIIKFKRKRKNYDEILQEKKNQKERKEKRHKMRATKKRKRKEREKMYGIMCWNDLIKYCRTKIVWLHRVHILILETNNYANHFLQNITKFHVRSLVHTINI